MNNYPEKNVNRVKPELKSMKHRYQGLRLISQVSLYFCASQSAPLRRQSLQNFSPAKTQSWLWLPPSLITNQDSRMIETKSKLTQFQNKGGSYGQRNPSD